MSIQCEICKREFNTITNSHVKTHNMTLAEYISKFPDKPTVSPEVSKKLSNRTKIANSKRNYTDVGKKISETKKKKFNSGELVPWNKGVPMDINQKEKLSLIKKGVATRTGAILSDETKEKISSSLKRKFNTEERKIARELKKKKLEEIRIKRENDRFDQFNKNVNENGLELVSINHVDRTVVLRCLTCNSEFERTKQAIEPSKCSKTVCRVCNPPATTSKAQIEIFDFIKSLGFNVVSEDRSILGGKEIDIFIPEKNIGIEFNGLYWHSELNYGEPKHLLWKQQFAHNKGVRIIHVFEDEWRDNSEIVKSRFKHILGVQTQKIYARKCKVKKISTIEKNIFLNANHLQGADISKVCYGLFYQDELVSVMTFKPGSFIKGHKGGWELNRFASKLNLSVIGGASKLFQCFIKEYKPDQVISFADRRWNLGKLYENLGFKFSHCSAPSYWYLEKYTTRYHRGKFMKHTLVHNESDNEKTEWEIMKERGYDRIWDCGTVVYKYSKGLDYEDM